MIVTLTLADFRTFVYNQNRRIFYALTTGNVTDVAVEKGFVDQTIHFQLEDTPTEVAFLSAYPAAIKVTSITEPSGGGGGTGTVTEVDTTSPITGGPITTTGTIGITQADTNTDGYITAVDWNKFNNAVVAIPTLSPDQISNLIGWWESDAITGLVDGDPVATWPDQASSPNDFTEATNKPTYKTNILNGYPAVRLNGTTQGMRSSLNVIHPMTLMIVANNRDVPHTHPSRWIQGQVANVPFGITENMGNNNYNVGYYNGAFIIYLSQSDYAIDTNFQIVTLTGADNNSRLYVGNQWVALRSAGTSTFGALALGLSGQTTSAQGADADLVAIVFYSRVLTPTEINGLRQHFRVKYGIN